MRRPTDRARLLRARASSLEHVRDAAALLGVIGAVVLVQRGAWAGAGVALLLAFAPLAIALHVGAIWFVRRAERRDIEDAQRAKARLTGRRFS